MMKKIIGEIDNKKIILVTIPCVQYYEEWNNESDFSIVLFYDRNNNETPVPLFNFARSAVLNGARTLIVTGENAESTHDLFDEEICALTMNGKLKSKDDCILTIYLKNKSITKILEETIYPYHSKTIYFVMLDTDDRLCELIKALEALVRAKICPT